MNDTARGLFVRSRPTGTGGKVIFLGPLSITATILLIVWIMLLSELNDLPSLRTVAVALSIGLGVWATVYLSRSTSSADSPQSAARPDVSRVLHWMRQAGETDAVLGDGIRNGGVDIESPRLAVEVVDRGGIVRMHTLGTAALAAAARKGKEPVVVSRRGYQPDVIAYASKAGLALFSYEVGSLLPVNDVARSLFANRAIS